MKRLLRPQDISTAASGHDIAPRSVTRDVERWGGRLFWTAVLLFMPYWLRGEGDGLPKSITTRSGIEMVLIHGGSFLMGDDDAEVDERPVHRVEISSFYMDKYEVTQVVYQRLTGNNPSRWKGDRNPVEQVRWTEAVEFCNARSRLEGLQSCYDLTSWECNFAADGYRLPTEAEWEYACRAGTKSQCFFGPMGKKLDVYAWGKSNSGGRERLVGGKLPNPWGLYDMYGNVWEWCHDRYQADWYRKSPSKNPEGPDTGETRIMRGGSWNSPAEECRSAYRFKDNPGYADVCFPYDVYGFRCVRRVREAP